jgi:hypothetical protein
MKLRVKKPKHEKDEDSGKLRFKALNDGIDINYIFTYPNIPLVPRYTLPQKRVQLLPSITIQALSRGLSKNEPAKVSNQKNRLAITLPINQPLNNEAADKAESHRPCTGYNIGKIGESEVRQTKQDIPHHYITQRFLKTKEIYQKTPPLPCFLLEVGEGSPGAFCPTTAFFHSSCEIDPMVYSSIKLSTCPRLLTLLLLAFFPIPKRLNLFFTLPILVPEYAVRAVFSNRSFCELSTLTPLCLVSGLSYSPVTPPVGE